MARQLRLFFILEVSCVFNYFVLRPVVMVFGRGNDAEPCCSRFVVPVLTCELLFLARE